MTSPSSATASAPPAGSLLRRLGALATALAVVAGLAVAGSAPAQAAGTAGRYVVTVDSTAVSQQVVRALGVADYVTYQGGTAGFTATLTARQQAALVADSRVVSVAPADVVVEGQAQVIPSHVLTAEADKAPVLAGDGVTNYNGPAVAVIDSGVNPNADYNLKDQINCFGSGDASDKNGHGTAVSGYMAAYDDGLGTVGVAPGAPIYSVRVLDENNKGTTEGIVCGLDWVSKNAAANNIKVVNMSLAAVGADDSNCGRTNNDVMHQMVCELVGKGITVVSSAGNASTPKNLAGAVPAAYDEVLTATNIANYDGKPGSLAAVPCANVTTKDDSVAINSNFAVSAADQAHTIAAPGMCPYTTKLGGGYAYVQSGTSMSAAAVSGVVLDCLSAGGSCVGKTPAQVRAQVIAQAKAGAERGRTFAGDPTRPTTGKYFGYAISTLPTTAAPEPTPTPTA
ncbi:S8 family serine peptidase, partial [Rathayibacter sp. ZW T2_19]